MINLIKSGIVCLVSMFLSEIEFIRKTRCNRNYLFKPISANISTERKQYVVVHMFINKTKCNRKYAVPIQNNQYKPAFQQRRKYVWCIFIWLHVANRRINHSFMSFPKYRSGFFQTCTHCQQDVEFRECCDWMYCIS